MRRRASGSKARLSYLLAFAGFSVALPATGEQSLSQMAADAKPAFEVATIRPTDPADRNTGFHLSGQRIYIENETAVSLISFAYDVHAKQIVGGPAWLSTEHFDAKGMPDVEGVPNLKQLQGMVQKLLADRFGLKFHHEQRELAVYAVTVANKGPKLERNTSNPNGMADETGNGGEPCASQTALWQTLCARCRLCWTDLCWTRRASQADSTTC